MKGNENERQNSRSPKSITFSTIGIVSTCTLLMFDNHQPTAGVALMVCAVWLFFWVVHALRINNNFSPFPGAPGAASWEALERKGGGGDGDLEGQLIQPVSSAERKNMTARRLLQMARGASKES